MTPRRRGREGPGNGAMLFTPLDFLDMRRSLHIVAAALLWLVPGTLLTAAAAPAPGAHTAVTLVADVQSLQPGTQFTAGLLLKMDAGWHTYWKNPGEAGLPTEVQWHLPAGFSAGQIAWPLPEKHTEAGEVLTYGYSNETMLLVPITVSASVKPGTRVTLSADVNWLECERTCVPGKASASLTLSVSTGAPAPDHAPLFAGYRARLPEPPPPGLRIEAHAVSGGVKPAGAGPEAASPEGGKTLQLAIALPAGQTPPADGVDFYPYELPGTLTGRSTAEVQGNNVLVNLPLTPEGRTDSARMVRGVLVLSAPRGGAPAKAYDLSVPLASGLLGSSSEGATGSGGAHGSLLDRQFTLASQAEQRPLILYLAFAFIGGLLLNIMPCVLPVVALKIFGLVKMAGDKPGRVRKMGWSFSGGILVSFLVLALLVILLQTAGQQVGWGFQFQEPLFVIAMSAVVFAFGLSLFGVYEIRLPAKALEGVGTVLQKQEGGSGYAASFSEGVFATVLATPCTAPFLGTALGFAFSQPAWAILLIFAVVAAGMALPYILLTSRPAWMKFLPKPGEWMVTAKQFMGFLMMATLLWLLYILGQQLGVEGVVWTGVFLLVVAVACWMIGRFLTLSATRGQTVLVWALALVLLVGGYLWTVAPLLRTQQMLAGAPMDPGSSEHGGVVWESFTPERLETHLREGRPVLIDFTAEWCLTCKVNEKTVLAREEVVDKLKNSGILLMRADWTNRNPDITKLLAKFGRSGVPLYVFFPAGRPSEPIVLPEVITTSMVVDAVDRAVAG